MIAAVLCLGPLSGAARGQDGAPASTGPAEVTEAAGDVGALHVLSDADFQLGFRKYATTAADFSPFYSWDADMGIDLSAVRKGNHAVDVAALIQTVGTENLRSKISVGATGYILGAEYLHAFRTMSLGGGYRHLSSHLTRDLDDKEEEVEARGGQVPPVGDPPEYNILYVKASGTLTRVPFTPRIVIVAAPFAFRFNGGAIGNVRRFYADTHWTLWQGRDRALIVETQHEVGSNGFDRYALQADFLRGARRTGRFQLILAIAPGHDLHVSPNVGAVMDGIALGFRLNFHD